MALAIELHPDEVEDHPSTPSHPSGKVTAFDEETGLPIVRREKSEISSTPVQKEGKTDEARTGGKGSDEGRREVATKKLADANAAGRDVLHKSTDRESLVRQAKDFARQFENGLKASTQGIKGARFESVRDEKTPTRMDEKIEKEGQPIETIPDILAGRIEADSHEAHEKTAAAVKGNFPVVRDIDEFKDGDPDFHYRAHKIQVQVTPELSGEVHIVPKEVLEAGFEQHADYQKARDADLAGDEKAEKKATGVARKINDEAMAAFEARQSKPETAEGGGGKSPEQSVAGSQDSANARKMKPEANDGKVRDDAVSGRSGEGGKREDAGSPSGRGGDSAPTSASRFAGRGKDGGAGGTSSSGSVASAEASVPIREQSDGAKLDKGSVPGSSSSASAKSGGHDLQPPKLARGVTVLVGDSHGIVRGGNPNFGSGGRWSVETPDGTKTLKGSELTPISAPKPKDQPWTGYDLDKTLATDHGWKGPTHIGEPTPLVENAKKDIADGKDVRIFSARVAEDPKGIARAAIEAWSHRNLGQAVPVTHEKDRWMERLYDDRARQVEPNTGKVVV